MLDAIGNLLPAAAGIALSPFPIVAIVLLLGTARSSANGISFLVGWLTGLGALTAAVVLVAAGAEEATSSTPTVIAWLRIVLGAGLLALAAKKLLAHRHDDAGSTTPGWMAGLDEATPRRAIVLGLLLGGANPKNIAFTLGAAPTISILGLSNERMVATSVLYVALASTVVAAMVLARLVAPTRSEAVIQGVGRFTLAHHTAITITILAIFGTKLIGDGLAVL